MQTYEQLARYGLFDAKVPRFTSYPPANHFSAGIGARDQAQWLSEIPDDAEISLYVHIPFCKRLCWFCACRTQGTQSLRPLAAYVDCLIDEIAMLRRALPRKLSASRVHLGGGTPTTLPTELMSDVLDSIFSTFDQADSFEFSAEIDPTDATTPHLELLREYGLNRASIGVQDFNPVVQAAIGREQSQDLTAGVIRTLRGLGVQNINLDLLYGLPNQTLASLMDTLDQALALEPDRMALYGYAHVPWMSKRQVMIKEKDLPSGRQRFEMTQAAREALIRKGYRPIGIDHFAAPNDALYWAAGAGRLRRNFQGYTDDQSDYLIGVGASAISKYPQGYVQNAPSTSVYQERVRADMLSGSKGYRLTDRDRIVGTMIERLMCDFAIDLSDPAHASEAFLDMAEPGLTALMHRYPEACQYENRLFRILPEAQSLTRIFCDALSQFSTVGLAHSNAS